MTILNLTISKMLKDLNLTGSLKAFIAGSLWLCLLFSCSDVQKREEPDVLLAKEKMIDIYTDLIMLDVIQRTNAKTLESYGISIPEHLLNKYNVDSITLAQNIEYYNFEFEDNMDIYQTVTENVERKKTYIDSIVSLRDSLEKEKREQKKDSIKKDTLKLKNKVRIKELNK